MPQIGEMLDGAEALRPVFGLAGNFSLGAARNERVLSVGCSAQLCLAKTDSKILSPTGSVAAPAGPALIAIQGNDAFVYLELSHWLVKWHDNSLDRLDWNVQGIPLSMRATTGGVEIAVRTADGVSIIQPDGAVVATIPDATGPVLLFDDGILLVAGQSLILRRPGVQDLSFGLPGVEALAALGEHYVQARVGAAFYALRTEVGREQLYALPGSSAVNHPLSLRVSQASVSDPLPAPLLDFGSGPIASGQQRTLTISLPSASPFTGSGLVRMTFLPGTGLITDDPFVTFLNPVVRVLSFTVTQGSTHVTINGQPGVVFQTGGTAGQIWFTLSGIPQGISGDPTTVLTVPSSNILLDTATATALQGELDVSLIGFDNTLFGGLYDVHHPFQDRRKRAGHRVGHPGKFRAGLHFLFQDQCRWSVSGSGGVSGHGQCRRDCERGRQPGQQFWDHQHESGVSLATLKG